ncbi:MAG: PhnD/SsuA/transferrin family substrate-binding protein [Pseudomonadota bacterium]
MATLRAGLLAAGVVAGSMIPASGLAKGPVLLQVFTDARSTTVASYRLERHLKEIGCPARLVFEPTPDAELTFRAAGRNSEHTPALRAVNRNGSNPVPVWVTRKTSGVNSLTELEGREVSLVAGSDPVGGSLALQALAEHGVRPARGQRYEAGDFSSALGLLLHNNTHAAASELGLVTPFLENQGLAITWQGQPVTGAGWYPENPDTASSARVTDCLVALGDLKRNDDRQIFQIFPEWVSGFAAPESQPNKETSR